MMGELREKIYDDKDVLHIIYMIEYSIKWYDEYFHGSETLQMNVDKTLSIFEYACYLTTYNIIGKKEFELIEYLLDGILCNYDVQAYLFNLHHWSMNNKTQCPFSNIIRYALDNKIWNDDFNDKNNPQYEKYLNF